MSDSLDILDSDGDIVVTGDVEFNDSLDDLDNDPTILSITRSGLPSGGTINQVLTKASAVDYDAQWVTGGAGAVDSVNTQTGAVVLDQDDVGDGTTYKQYSDTEKTKLAGIETGAQVNTVTPSNTVTLTNKTTTGLKMDGALDTGGVKIIEYTANPTAVNYLVQRAGSTGQAVLLSAESVTDTDVYLNLQSQGAGTVRANGVDVDTISGTQTLTNKTITSPKVNEILDTNGTKLVTLTTTAAAVNYLDIKNNATTFTPSITAVGTDTNININLDAKGTGRVRANSVIIPTVSSADTLTNKTINLTDNTLQATIAQLNTATAETIVTRTGTLTLTNKTLTSPVINTPTGIVKGDVGLGNVDNTSNATERAATATLTNKRVTKRTGTATSSATPTINTDNVDFYSLTAQAADITSFTTNLSGTPTEGQTLWIAITGTAARAITWGASFEASTVALPTTTVTTNRLDVGFVWNTVTSKWRCIASC